LSLPHQLPRRVHELPAHCRRCRRCGYGFKESWWFAVAAIDGKNSPWRHAKVTDRRASSDFAECMRDLVDRHHPKAERIRVVLDNLSTHTPAALYECLEPTEARRVLRRLEFHYTPKHASWLNMVEIEIGVMVSQCLDRRIPTKAKLVSEVKAWERRRNRDKARIKLWVLIGPKQVSMPTPKRSSVQATASGKM
jgi:hypothetical protein